MITYDSAFATQIKNNSKVPCWVSDNAKDWELGLVKCFYNSRYYVIGASSTKTVKFAVPVKPNELFKPKMIIPR